MIRSSAALDTLLATRLMSFGLIAEWRRLLSWLKLRSSVIPDPRRSLRVALKLARSSGEIEENLRPARFDELAARAMLLFSFVVGELHPVDEEFVPTD